MFGPPLSLIVYIYAILYATWWYCTCYCGRRNHNNYNPTDDSKNNSKSRFENSPLNMILNWTNEDTIYGLKLNIFYLFHVNFS